MKDTQLESLDKLKPHERTIRARVLACISNPLGRAAFEVCAALKLGTSTVTGRIRELELEGKICDSGLTRWNEKTKRQCVVYKACDGDADRTGPYGVISVNNTVRSVVAYGMSLPEVRRFVDEKCGGMQPTIRLFRELRAK